MKNVILTSLLASTLLFTTVSQAKPTDHRHGAAPGLRFIHQLRDLSLTDEQHQQIRALVRDFKTRHQAPHHDGREEWLTELMTGDDADISTQVKDRFNDRETKAFAVASLRHAIYSLLSDTQRQALAEDSERDHDRPKPRRSHTELFKKLGLKSEQDIEIAALAEDRDALMQDFHSEMVAFRNAERALIRSDAFSYERWLTVLEPHRIRLLELAQAKATNQHAMFNVLNEHQQQMFLTLLETHRPQKPHHRARG
ncbi:Spy/CpxP family protein refolding chaperone [Alteromonas halophila]|uniref:LTXXQ motif family protein n=1 Tax=Alteromonas halophila TaxID=516698 RepID=A0A918JIG3_9ALTE|nr:Spy/CpxP family protein refolding chaperone [Alteromonas halophila]GGW78971.1 hypothetical protein GCM10007391_09530 [Alteromonas halophila]